jgi:hypothetical protein
MVPGTQRDEKKLPEICPEIPTNKFKKPKKGYLEWISGTLISIVMVSIYSRYS